MSEAIRQAVGVLAAGDARPDPALLRATFEEILSGKADESCIAAFLMGLHIRGETAAELLAGARSLRTHARRMETGDDIVDTCGTGGLSWTSLNTSTAAACVAAAGGVRIAKHGNRSVPPKTGSADVLEALGVNLEASDAQLHACLDQAGLAFLFAPAHHGAMRHVAPVRRSLAIRTIFNLLGPLSNPAGAKRQVLGVFDEKWVRPMAEALQGLGTHHALIVHGIDGIDEISVSGPTAIAELKKGEITQYQVKPEDFGISASPLSGLRGGKPDANAQAIRDVLNGRSGPFADAVALNAGAALYVGGKADGLKQGVQSAQGLIANKAGASVLDALIKHSHGR